MSALPAAVLAAVIVVGGTGVWLTRAGRPYGTPLQTAHKLVALAGFVTLCVLAYRAGRADMLTTPIAAFLGLTAVLAVAAFATGGVLAAREDAAPVVLWTHRIGSWLSLATAVGLALYLA